MNDRIGGHGTRKRNQMCLVFAIGKESERGRNRFAYLRFIKCTNLIIVKNVSRSITHCY